MTALLDAALDYAARGWQIFPLKPRSKDPATLRGFYDATSNPATLHRWFAQGHPYNVAVRTGQPSGIFVFDADDEIGAASLRELECKYEPLPATLISLTGKGRHFWFAANAPISCSAGKIAANVDIRGDGGYVVVPPSIHPNGAIYRWIDRSMPPAPAPEWLVCLAQRPKPLAIPRPVRRTNPGHVDAYGRAALDREIEALSQVAKGARNDALNCVSFRLHQLVAGGELDAGEVQQRLIAAAQANGLMTDPEDGPRKTIATINSGAKAGLQFPRSRSERR